jgi:SAM-dependent methyltransferase
MRVLDIGCGAGCAALVLAGLVGESGAVIGIDRAPAAVASAVERVRKLGKRNISFCVAEVGEIENESFDAVAGRYVLLFNPERAEMVKVARRLTRSGGVIVFHEPDFSHIKGHPSNPPAPLYDRAMGLIVETLSGCGSNPYMALGLYRAFTKAGLEPTRAAARGRAWAEQGVLSRRAKPAALYALCGRRPAQWIGAGRSVPRDFRGQRRRHREFGRRERL